MNACIRLSRLRRARVIGVPIHAPAGGNTTGIVGERHPSFSVSNN